MEQKLVYVGLAADLIHQGHLNIIAQGCKVGKVTTSILTDEAIAGYKRLPLIAFKERKLIVENLKGVEKVIPQKTLDYVPNLIKLKPDFVVHGDDWKTGIQKEVRQRVIDVLAKWGIAKNELPILAKESFTKGRMDNNIVDLTEENVNNILMSIY